MTDWDGGPSAKAPPLLHVNSVHLKKGAAVESVECSAIDLFDLTRDCAKDYQIKQNDGNEINHTRPQGVFSRTTTCSNVLIRWDWRMVGYIRA